MKKELSLNTQIEKLRKVNNLLKYTLTDAQVEDSLSSQTAYRVKCLDTVIRSLRDIQYMLRGTVYKASVLTKKMSIDEICSYLNSETSLSKSGPYYEHLQEAAIELQTVQEFLRRNGFYYEARRQKDPEMEIANKYIELIVKNNLPIPSPRLLKYICTEAERKMAENDELF